MASLAACSTGVESDPFAGYSDPVDDEMGDEASPNPDEAGELPGETGDGDGDGDGEESGDGDGDEMAGNAYCDPVAHWEADWIANEQALVDLINQMRAEGRTCGEYGAIPPAPVLSPDTALGCASRVHSADMANRDYFDHNDLEGNDPNWRLDQAGYTGDLWAENIGAGYPTAAALLEGWLESDDHCANMLNTDFTTIGVGYAFGPNATYAHYWTLMLGN